MSRAVRRGVVVARAPVGLALTVCTTMALGQPVPVSSDWNTDSDGVWANAANWTNGDPSNNAVNSFNVTIDRGAANPTVTLNANRTIDALTNAETLSFDLSRSLTVGGDVSNTGTVVFNGSAGLTADRFTNDGTLQVVGALGSTNTLTAELFNNSLLDVDRGLLINKSFVSHSNVGTIDIRRRERLSFSGTAYSLLNTGTVNLGRRR